MFHCSTPPVFGIRMPLSTRYSPRLNRLSMRVPHPVSRWVFTFGALLAATSGAAAENWRVSPSVTTTATATNNAGYDDSRNDGSDVIFDLAPRLQVFGEGGNYLLDADFGFDGLIYTRGSRSNEILPQGQLKFKSTLVDRWVYFDANARVAQTAENPFLGRTDVATGANRLMTVSYDVAPYLSHEFTQTLLGTARTQWAWNRRESLSDIDAQSHQLRLEQRTIPIGWAIDYSNQRTHYQGDDDPALRTSALRATGVYAPDTRWKYGVIVGRERNEFGGSTDNDKIVGLSFEGAPTDRTLLAVLAERRFFGTGWNLSLRHRSPFLGLSAQWQRHPTAQGNSQDVASNVTSAQLLDAMLITRHPDPSERAEIVADTLAQMALPSQLGGALEITASSPQLEQTSRLSALFQGRLTTVTFSAYLTQLSPLRRTDGGAPAVLPDALSTRQHGVSIDFNRRLNELTTADAYFEISQLRRTDQDSPDFTRDKVARLSLTRQLDPSTSASLALRRRLRHINLADTPNSLSETGLVVGLSHRF